MGIIETTEILDFTNRNDDLSNKNVENMVFEPRKRCTSIADLTEITIIKIRHGLRITTIKSSRGAVNKHSFATH